MLAAAIGISVAPAAAQTALSFLCVSPDITVALSSSGTVTPQDMLCYGFPLSSGPSLFPFSIPPGVNVTGYFDVSSTQALITIDTTAALPTNGSGGTVTVTPHDVAEFNSSTGYFLPTLYFSGTSYGIPDGTRIDAVGMDLSGDLLLSFDVTVSLPAPGSTTITVKPADLVSFNGSTYTLVFNSASAGIPDGTNLVGAMMLPNGDLLTAFDVIGSIGGVDFTPTDVLEFNPSASSWVLSFNGASSDDWPDGSIIQGVFAEVAPTATATGARNGHGNCDCNQDGDANRDCNRNQDGDRYCNQNGDARTYCDRHRRVGRGDGKRHQLPTRRKEGASRQRRRLIQRLRRRRQLRQGRLPRRPQPRRPRPQSPRLALRPRRRP